MAVELDFPRAVTQIKEGDLTHRPVRHNPPGNTDFNRLLFGRVFLYLFEQGNSLLCGMAAPVAVGVGVDTAVIKPLQLLQSLPVYPVCSWCHLLFYPHIIGIVERLRDGGSQWDYVLLVIICVHCIDV